MFEIRNEDGYTALFYKNQLQFRKKGNFSIEEMGVRLNGYLLDSLDELPAEIDVSRNNGSSDIDELIGVFEFTKNVKKDLDLFLK